MEDWKFVEKDPSEALARLHFFSIKKKHASGEGEARITVKEFASAKTRRVYHIVAAWGVTRHDEERARTTLARLDQGITLRQVVFDIGGGTRKPFKAIQTGGPLGGCLSAAQLDIPIDYESMRANGSGSNETTKLRFSVRD